MKITFRQIDAFKTVVQSGTVTETARMLGISQPAVSRLIADLESQVGFKLFARSGRNLKATPEALLLVEEVRRALSGLEQIKHTATAIKNFKDAQLRLISTPAFSTLIAPQLIQKFAHQSRATNHNYQNPVRNDYYYMLNFLAAIILYTHQK